MSDAETITQEAFDKLTEELQHRSTTLRQEITDRIEEARAYGDLKENAEYHAAKDEQGMNEDRIRLIERRLRNSVIATGDPAGDGLVSVGVIVTIDDDGDQEDLFIGSLEDQPDDANVSVVGVSSPMGQALLGAKKGDTVSYAGPTGTTFEITVVEIRNP